MWRTLTVAAAVVLVVAGVPGALAAQDSPPDGIRPAVNPFGPGLGDAPLTSSEGTELGESLLVPTASGIDERAGTQDVWWNEVGPQGSVAVGGTDYSDGPSPYIAVYDATGEQSFSRVFNSFWDQGWTESVVFGPQGALYTVLEGRDLNPTDWGVKLVKMTLEGEILWIRSHGAEDPSVRLDYREIEFAPNGDLVGAGLRWDTGSASLDIEMRVTRFDADGTQLWTSSSEALPHSFATGVDVAPTGTIHVAGAGLASSTGDNDPLYWRFSPEGDEVSNLNAGDEDQHQYFFDVAVQPAGGTHLVGTTWEAWGVDLQPLTAEIGVDGTIDHLGTVNGSAGYYGTVDVATSGTVYAAGGGYLEALDGDGNLLWSTSDALEGADGEVIRAVSTGPGDRLHVAGHVAQEGSGADGFAASLVDLRTPAAGAHQVTGSLG